jgi:putative oxidoreductase
MKAASIVAGALLGLLFAASGMVVLLKLIPVPPLPEGTPPAHFMAAFAPTGYLTFVKAFEVVGGVLVAVPRTRRAGLLVLGPIIINILAFHVFVAGGEGLWSPQLLVICALALFLVWVERAAFLEFLGPRSCPEQIADPA